ncbi:MAG: prohibitin family protein [Lachnospiraceae bacterium]|nr:prohibitin family protein [Lachnospiraceae bacterium]MEE1341367.1 prohibitin family protein [Lachnospiraceae bacterium]
MEEKKNKGVGKIVAVVIALFALAIIAINSFTIVPSGHTGVVVRLGAVQDTLLEEGVHFKIPFITKIVVQDNRTQIAEIEGSAASKDLQTVSNKIAVNFKVNKEASGTLYKNVGLDYKTTIVIPAIQEAVKSATAQYTAEELITKRTSVSQSMKDELTAKVQAYGISIENLNIVNFDFTKEFNEAIESKQTAQQLALKAQEDLKRIKIEAEQAIVKAEGEAKALAAKSKTVNDNILQLEFINKWDGKMPYVVGGDGTLINLSDLITSNTKTTTSQK